MTLFIWSDVFATEASPLFASRSSSFQCDVLSLYIAVAAISEQTQFVSQVRCTASHQPSLREESVSLRLASEKARACSNQLRRARTHEEVLQTAFRGTAESESPPWDFN
eukprot:TRINITY_DN96669_c0_g1_i1.p1 TRINITY_DN96669_c0_g1~~TRINITY_DN96669_c0_g1_i1.p1  ORF type:complete len:109 (+),score=7.97 TRINITY_DN96669_c0_g1_i1:36-362(+)